MRPELKRFVADYLKDLREGNAAVFAGAGLSVASGFVDWRNLLRPIADDLDLDISRETDLVALAQFHWNEARSRHKLNQLLIDQFSDSATPTTNHRLLARLPIDTFWTTNYDRLIELALRDAGKIADVKYEVPQLATTRARRDAIVYKMHGDVEHPHRAVLIKDDYERYQRDWGAFITALAGDLVSKTFLFLGFSFTDPNLDHVLSRIRMTFEENQRRHYCFLKRRVRERGETDEELRHAETRQKLMISDLLRFNIKTLLVDEYAEITETLTELERLYRRKTVFISGSAEGFGAWSSAVAEDFIRSLSEKLSRNGYRVATGFGVGVGDAVISGVLEHVFSERSAHIEDVLIVRPFPRALADPAKREALWDEYRRSIISQAGVCVFIFGNKRIEEEIKLADGVRREFDIAHSMGADLVPVGATGFMASELWQEVVSNIRDYYPDVTPAVETGLLRLGDSDADADTLISSILDLLGELTKESS